MENQVTQLALDGPSMNKDLLVGNNIPGISPKTLKLDTQTYKLVTTLLTSVSLAKNIQLMDGTLTTWEKLVADDLIEGNYELKDLIKAVNVGIRTNMYNRIDYYDIFKEASGRCKNRRTEEYINKKVLERREKNSQPATKITEDFLSSAREALRKSKRVS